MQSRAAREKAGYDIRIDRGAYSKVFSHSRAYSDLGDKIKNATSLGHSRVVLELGYSGWYTCWKKRRG